MDTNLQKMFRESIFSVSSESYYYCKINKYPKDVDNHFMISNDEDEITVITKEIKTLDLLEKNDNEWLLVSLNLSIPFMKGTLFNVSKAIYEAETNVLIVSTYSKDILFIKKQDKKLVIEALKNIGMKYR